MGGADLTPVVEDDSWKHTSLFNSSFVQGLVKFTLY